MFGADWGSTAAPIHSRRGHYPWPKATQLIAQALMRLIPQLLASWPEQQKFLGFR